MVGQDLSALPVYPDDLPPIPEAEAFVSEVFQRYGERAAAIQARLHQRRTGNEPTGDVR